MGQLEPRARLANFYLQTGERQKAIDIAQEAVASNPEHPAALELLGNVQLAGGALPVALGGLYLTDTPIGAPDLSRIHDLSFLGANSFTAFTADGDGGKASHANFQLPSEQGQIGLLSATLKPIDCIAYGPQQPDISQGKCPNGGATYATLGAGAGLVGQGLRLAGVQQGLSIASGVLILLLVAVPERYTSRVAGWLGLHRPLAWVPPPPPDLARVVDSLLS